MIKDRSGWTEKERTQYFIQLYIFQLRIFYKNNFLREPNPISERYTQLDKARQIVDDLGGEYSDYITFQFKAFRNIRIAPQPYHLISAGAVKRYAAHQRLANIYNTEEYSVRGDYFIVSKTRKGYPLSQILLPVSQDTIALRAYDLLALSSREDLDSFYYLEAKLKYKGAIIPDKLKEILHEIV
jgi:hypothetical protein